MKVEEKIDLVGRLLNFISANNNFSDYEDIRSITIDSFAVAVQYFFISLILSKELQKIDYVQSKISDQFKEFDLKDIEFNFDGFVKDALFTKLFISVESNFRTIARHLEKTTDDINNTSIKITFERLLDANKTNLFTTIDAIDKDIIICFFYLRNTIHNFGIHTKPNHILEIEDSTSLISKSKVTIELVQNQPNSISTENLLLLFEQVIKVIIKFNSVIPTTEKIKHPLADFGYNL